MTWSSSRCGHLMAQLELVLCRVLMMNEKKKKRVLMMEEGWSSGSGVCVRVKSLSRSAS